MSNAPWWHEEVDSEPCTGRELLWFWGVAVGIGGTVWCFALYGVWKALQWVMGL